MLCVFIYLLLAFRENKDSIRSLFRYFVTMSSDQNLLEVFSKLERQKKELEANLEQMQHRSLSLKRRKDEVGRELAALEQLNASKESALNSVRNQVDILQNQFSCQQDSVHKTQEMLKDLAEQTKDQANRRFDMIGEFEEELAKFADTSAKHAGQGTLRRLDRKVNVLTSKEAKLTSDLEDVVREMQSLNVEPVNSQSPELSEAIMKCQKAFEEVSCNNDEVVSEVAQLKSSLRQL